MIQCPVKRYYKYTKGMFDVFQDNFYQRLVNLELLPDEVLNDLWLVKIQYVGDKFIKSNYPLNRPPSLGDAYGDILVNFFKRYVKSL